MLETKEIVKNLINVLDLYKNGKQTISNQGQSLDGYSALSNFIALVEQLKENEKYVTNESV